MKTCLSQYMNLNLLGLCVDIYMLTALVFRNVLHVSVYVLFSFKYCNFLSVNVYVLYLLIHIVQIYFLKVPVGRRILI
jgi:hypothetical protein